MSRILCFFILTMLNTASLLAEKEFTYKHYPNLQLSKGVSIDDPNRIIVWRDGAPQIIERSKDSDKWLGDSDYWSKGEFFEHRSFPEHYPHGTPGINIRTSKHIRIIYGNHPKCTEEYIKGNLRLFEEALKLYYLKMGFPPAFESADPKKRDGKKYKLDVIVGGSNFPKSKGDNYTGEGCYGCFDGKRSFG